MIKNIDNLISDIENIKIILTKLKKEYNPLTIMIRQETYITQCVEGQDEKIDEVYKDTFFTIDKIDDFIEDLKKLKADHIKELREWCILHKHIKNIGAHYHLSLEGIKEVGNDIIITVRGDNLLEYDDITSEVFLWVN